MRILPWWLQPLVILLLLLVLVGQWAMVSNAKGRALRAEKDLVAYKLAASESARLAQAEVDRKGLEQLNRQKEAADAAQTREASLRADAAGARAERDSLLDAVRAATATPRPGLPAAPAAPGYQHGSALIELFGACTAEVQELASAADGHASDVRTLIDSWPR
jgi:hypothetical protein